MNTAQEASAGKEKTKKGFWSKFMNFLMYGGFSSLSPWGLPLSSSWMCMSFRRRIEFLKNG